MSTRGVPRHPSRPDRSRDRRVGTRPATGVVLPTSGRDPRSHLRGISSMRGYRRCGLGFHHVGKRLPGCPRHPVPGVPLHPEQPRWSRPNRGIRPGIGPPRREKRRSARAGPRLPVHERSRFRTARRFHPPLGAEQTPRSDRCPRRVPGGPRREGGRSPARPRRFVGPVLRGRIASGVLVPVLHPSLAGTHQTPSPEADSNPGGHLVHERVGGVSNPGEFPPGKAESSAPHGLGPACAPAWNTDEGRVEHGSPRLVPVRRPPPCGASTPRRIPRFQTVSSGISLTFAVQTSLARRGQRLILSLLP